MFNQKNVHLYTLEVKVKQANRRVTMPLMDGFPEHVEFSPVLVVPSIRVYLDLTPTLYRTIHDGARKAVAQFYSVETVEIAKSTTKRAMALIAVYKDYHPELKKACFSHGAIAAKQALADDKQWVLDPIHLTLLA